jgi:ATP-dependent DNA helicase RecG
MKRYSPIDPVGILSGVGAVYNAELQRMNIRTMTDLIRWYPRAYIDATQLISIAELQVGVTAVIKLQVDQVKQIRIKGRNQIIVRALGHDQTGSVPLTWFNQPYVADFLQKNPEVTFLATLTEFKGQRQIMNPQRISGTGVLPRYPQSSIVKTKLLVSLIDQVLPSIEDWSAPVPDVVWHGQYPGTYAECVRVIHRPESMNNLESARNAAAFAEVWEYLLRTKIAIGAVQKVSGIAIPSNVDVLKQFTQNLPFSLTDGQRRVVWDIAQELSGGTLVTHIINGDVGAGKTAVAAGLLALVVAAGHRGLVLAPTEVLAVQHYQTLQSLYKNQAITVGIRTASHKHDLNSSVVVGTHALLQDGEHLEGSVGLVIIDEQHRFGVRQRAQLRAMQEIPPHLISMTATPIPRTLALTLFGDVPVSILQGRPKSQAGVVTRLAKTSVDAEVLGVIAAARKRNEQVFIVCPAIKQQEKVQDSTDQDGQITLWADNGPADQGKKAVTAELARWQRDYPEFGPYAALHGGMSSKEKTAVMAAVQSGEVGMLISTTVIEVGVDVANATVMVIEDAFQFGLAQLHQLRGRIGRSTKPGICYLVSKRPVQRLQILVETTDGFAIAQADLAERGPGDLQGVAQAGLPDFRMASLANIPLLESVHEQFVKYTGKNPDYVATAAQKLLVSDVVNRE